MQELLSRLGTLDSKIGSIPLEDIARSTGFIRRSARKAGARPWLQTICLLSSLPSRSYRTFGWLLGLIQGHTQSKQNVAKRIHEGFEGFLREVLSQITAKMVRPGDREQVDACFSAFGRVIVQDSTIVALPAHLVDRFPGSSNQTGKPTASMRIEAFFDLLSESCLHFSTSPFTSNDQKASSDIFAVAQPGDLVIRDLGYSCLAVFKRMADQGIHFLSRLSSTVEVFDENSDPIDLLARLKREKYLDIPVLIGQKARLPCRLIAVPVPETVAAERRRKAKANRDRRLNPSQKRLRLLSWTFLITSVPAGQPGAHPLVKIYALRWRIETLFKAWKSHLNFASIPPYASPGFAVALFLAGLLYVALFQCIFQQLQRINSPANTHLSHLKLASILQNLLAIELQSIIHAIPPDRLRQLTLYHCSYDRRKRPNHYQIIADISLG